VGILMGRFTWQGTDARGRLQRGECSAEALSEAATQLRARGLAPVSVDRVDEGAAVRSTVTSDAFTLFNRNLAEMTAIGLPLPRAIHEIASGLKRGRWKQGLEGVERALHEGKPLDEAIAGVDGLFPSYYRWMLKAAAASGNLPAVLSAVARNTEGIRVARRAFLESLIYPAVIVLMALLLAAATLGIFVPFYREYSGREGVGVPILEFFLRPFEWSAWAGGALLGSVAAGGGLFWFLGRTVAGERFLQKVPLSGRIRRHLMMARLLGSLGVMLRAEVPFPRALPVALGAAGSLELDRMCQLLTSEAGEGRGLGEILAHTPGVSPEVAAFLALAERTGDAPHASAKVAELLTEQALSESEALFVILVPAAILAAGVVVGGCLVSVVVPYFQFLESMHT
jgi:type II secretory pathway component PulF